MTSFWFSLKYQCTWLLKAISNHPIHRAVMTTTESKSKGAKAKYLFCLWPMSPQRTIVQMNNFLYLGKTNLSLPLNAHIKTLVHGWFLPFSSPGSLISSYFVFFPQSEALDSSTLEANNREVAKLNNFTMLLLRLPLDPQVILTKVLHCTLWIREIESTSLWSY